MRKKLKILLPILAALGFVAISIWYLRGHNIPVLEPAGQVGRKERNLILFALGLSLVVVIPVFVLLFSFAWRYREGNDKAKYSPDLDHNRTAETVWWLIPTALILILSVVTWNSSHDLDPYRKLVSTTKPLDVQVVSLDWKWLFIYPEQHIATVNFMQVPVNTPIDFYLTSDTVMNSFWVPQLGGQIYAMPGMSTQLHLVADKAGDYYGSPANITGKGFAGMTFDVRAASQADFNNWVNKAQQSPNALTTRAYGQLSKPSENNQVVYYSGIQSGLYDTIIMKYMTPIFTTGGSHNTMQGMGM